MRVNELLLSDTHSDLFVTMWYGIWDPASGRVTYTSAGHNPPFVVNASNDTVQPLRLRGIALGVLPDIQLKTETITLHPGDCMVLYTDGITEARSPLGEEFSVARLENATRYNCQAANDVLNGVVQALDRHTGDEPQFDDLTLVVLRRQETPEAEATGPS